MDFKFFLFASFESSVEKLLNYLYIVLYEDTIF